MSCSPIADYRKFFIQDKICCPSKEKGILNILGEINTETKKGLIHKLYQDYQLQYGDNGLSTNILLPYVNSYFSENIIIQDIIIVNHPEDAERLTNKHIKKAPIFKSFLYDSLISTTNKDHWIEQRKIFGEAFYIREKLSKISHLSQSIAQNSCKKLWTRVRNLETRIDINEFFLNETMTQLMIVLFGVSNDFQERTNKKIREALRTFSDYAGHFAYELIDEIKRHGNGPLSESFQNRIPNQQFKREEYGNALLFTFAGHDSTGHTLTWLLYELSRNYNYQIKLQREVDLFWQIQGKQPIVIDDFKKLPFMTGCIAETMRLWPALANGTHRELIEDDYVIGNLGEKVSISKGTLIQIPNLSRHHNKDLWGNDADIFNPNREFKGDEIWNNTIFNTYNPSTERFSPFTYGPRDCIGKNFAQIEMRFILLYLLKTFNFSLSDHNVSNIEINHLILAPRNTNNKSLQDTKTGLYLNVSRRITQSKM